MGRPPQPDRPRRNRGRSYHRRPLSVILLLLGLAIGGSSLSMADPPEGTARALLIERIEAEGNHRTTTETLIAASGLRTDQPASADRIVAATRRLRESGLFREVRVHTRPGSRPGAVVVVFAVEENRPHFRLGLGYEDLSGWYLIPLQLNLDNLSGRGEQFRLSSRLGFRLSGLELSYRRLSRTDPRRFWELSAWGEGQDRVYFFDQTEFSHPLTRTGLDLRIGRPLDDRLAVEGWISLGQVEADSTSEVRSDREVDDRRRGDVISFEELPPGIQAGVDKQQQTRLGFSLGLDTRSGRGLARRGLWGRIVGEAIFTEDQSLGTGEWDLRGFLPLASGLQLAARTRVGIVSAGAPFYERRYLGGLYTIRGYPSQSLSPPRGNLRFATGSVELRSSWIGPPIDPRLVGLLFLDLGVGWDHGAPDLDEGAAGLGYGLRVRLPWLGRAGLDVGYPLSPTPVDESFHANLSIGWTF